MEGRLDAALVTFPVNELLAVENAHVFEQPRSKVRQDFVIQVAPHLAGILQPRLHQFVVVPLREFPQRGISGSANPVLRLLLGGRLTLGYQSRQPVSFLASCRQAQVWIATEDDLLLAPIQAITKLPCPNAGRKNVEREPASVSFQIPGCRWFKRTDLYVGKHL